MIGAEAYRGHHLENSASEIGAGRIDNRFDIGKRYLIQPFLLTISIEGGKSTVAGLHAHGPVCAGANRTLFGHRVIDLGPCEDFEDHRGIVHVGISVVEKLKRPSARGESGSLDRPISLLENLMID